MRMPTYDYFFENGFVVYELDPKTDDTIDILAFGVNVDVAAAAMSALRFSRPHSVMEIRQRARIIRRSAPG